MRQIRSFLLGASFLAVLNIILRCVSVSFNAYVSLKLGTEGTGLFTLVMSVYGFAVIVATSGVNLAAVRLTAERTALASAKGCAPGEYRACVRQVMASCAAYSLLFSLPSAGVLFVLSPYIGKYLLSDIRTVLSLRALAVSLPAISLTSAITGYFTGIRKIYKNAWLTVTEQGMKILFTTTALTVAVPPLLDRVEYSCMAVVGGSVVSEILTFIFSALMFAFDKKRPRDTTVEKTVVHEKPVRFGRNRASKLSFRRSKYVTMRDVSSVSLPVALGSYARQGLSTAEHLAIPWGMKRSGLDASSALSSYGVLHGMVFPLILFPSAVIASFAGLLVPEVAELHAMGERDMIKKVVKRMYSAALIFSVGAAAVFLSFAGPIGEGIYGSSEASRMILLTAPLVPVMYLDTAVDGVLKGLGEQLHSMKINIIDSASSLLLVLVLVPRFGIDGYIVSVYFCEGLNTLLSVLRLKKVTGVGIDFLPNILLPLSAAIATSSVAGILPLPGGAATGMTIVASVGMYLLLCFGMLKLMSGKVGKNITADKLPSNQN